MLEQTIKSGNGKRLYKEWANMGKNHKEIIEKYFPDPFKCSWCGALLNSDHDKVGCDQCGFDGYEVLRE